MAGWEEILDPAQRYWTERVQEQYGGAKPVKDKDERSVRFMELLIWMIDMKVAELRKVIG